MIADREGQEVECGGGLDAALFLQDPKFPASQRSTLTAGQQSILAALDLPEPPKYLDFTPGTDAAVAD